MLWRLGKYWRTSPLVFSLVPRFPGVMGRGEVKAGPTGRGPEYATQGGDR
jgi:hypothetical protein